jgi:hypothetical protein
LHIFWYWIWREANCRKLLSKDSAKKLQSRAKLSNIKGVISMDKKDLKKAALLGLLIGAAAISAPADAYEPMSSQGMTLAHGCGKNCSGGGASRGGNLADADESETQAQPGTSHSCAGSAQPQNSNGRMMQQNGNGRMMPQASCNGTPRPMQPQASCNGTPGRTGY